MPKTNGNSNTQSQAGLELTQSFLVVAEELNFRRSAERLNVDQSALTRRIQKLEHLLGFALFERTTREVTLTPAGRSFYEGNERLLQTYSRAVKSARLVAEEMRELKSRFAPDHLWFADDIFALSQQWTLEFAAAVEALQAQIPFKMQSRCDLMTRPTVEALRRAGCAEVWMGVESGAQDVLDAMDKGTRLWQVYEARENLRRHGIRACFFLQFGYPGETWTEIEKTIALVRETRPDDIGVSVSYPLPGTAFHQMVSSQLGPKENWADSDDLDILFQGAFTSDFYRALADALHLEVREGSAAAADAWGHVLSLKETCARQGATKLPIWTSC